MAVWILIGLVVGTAVCTVGDGLRPDRRRRPISDAAALGYRVGLGENPATMRMRDNELDRSPARRPVSATRLLGSAWLPMSTRQSGR